jgi:hypothetical protein
MMPKQALQLHLNQIKTHLPLRLPHPLKRIKGTGILRVKISNGTRTSTRTRTKTKTRTRINGIGKIGISGITLVEDGECLIIPTCNPNLDPDQIRMEMKTQVI